MKKKIRECEKEISQTLLKRDFENRIQSVEWKIKSFNPSLQKNQISEIVSIEIDKSLSSLKQSLETKMEQIVHKMSESKKAQSLNDLKSEIEKNYSQERLDSLHEKILESSLRLQTLIPTMKLPQLIWMNSGFNIGAYSTDEYLAVGLDFYLGQNNRITKSVPFPQYQKEDMTRAQLVPNAIKNLAYYYM